MVEIASDVQPSLTREQVSVIVNDPELRKLKPASPEYQAAISKKFGTDGTQKSESAPDTKVEAPVETNKEAPAQAAASNDDEDAALGARAQKRIAKLTAERNQEKALRTQLESRIAELEKAGKTPAQAERQATAEHTVQIKFDKPKPKVGDFATLEDYNDAVVDWKLEKRDAEAEAKAQARKTQESAASKLKEFWDAGSKLEKELGLDAGNFSTLVSELRLPNSTIQAVVESEFGPKVALELANLDVDAKARLEKMTEIQQVAFIGRLEAKFEAKSKTKTETQAISAAKTPVKALKKGSGGSTPGQVTSMMSFREFEAIRKAQAPNKFRR